MTNGKTPRGLNTATTTAGSLLIRARMTLIHFELVSSSTVASSHWSNATRPKGYRRLTINYTTK